MRKDEILKNWKPKEIVAFLIRNGFEEIKRKKRGDHKSLFNRETGSYTEIDMGKHSFSAREMLTIAKQSGIPRIFWRRKGV